MYALACLMPVGNTLKLPPAKCESPSHLENDDPALSVTELMSDDNQQIAHFACSRMENYKFDGKQLGQSLSYECVEGAWTFGNTPPRCVGELICGKHGTCIVLVAIHIDCLRVKELLSLETCFVNVDFHVTPGKTVVMPHIKWKSLRTFLCNNVWALAICKQRAICGSDDCKREMELFCVFCHTMCQPGTGR